MTKKDIVLRVSRATGQPQDLVFTLVQKTLDVLSDAMKAGRTIELRNFGVFEVKVRKARVGRNPHRPEKDVAIPARAVVKFKAGKELRAAVVGLTEQIQNGAIPAEGPSAEEGKGAPRGRRAAKAVRAAKGAAKVNDPESSR